MTPHRSVKTTPQPVLRAIREAAENIAVWRKLRGLTQAQTADRADVSLNTVRRLEGGDGGISLENRPAHIARARSARQRGTRPGPLRNRHWTPAL